MFRISPASTTGGGGGGGTYSGAGLIKFLVLLVRCLFGGRAYSGAGLNRVNTVIQMKVNIFEGDIQLLGLC